MRRGSPPPRSSSSSLRSASSAAGPSAYPLGIGFRQQRVEVDGRVVHLNALAVRRARPLLLGTVAVELDAVPVRVTQVDRLRDAMVGRALQRPSRLAESAQRVAERASV